MNNHINEENQKMKLNIRQLSCCTGFPPETLLDFAERGLLPKAGWQGLEETTFDGLALLLRLEEANYAR